MRTVVALLILMALGGCATQPPYGNFIPFKEARTVDQVTMANDALEQIEAMYPPAKTRFTTYQTTPDVFGQTLVQKLRVRGYEVHELAPVRERHQRSLGADRPNDVLEEQRGKGGEQDTPDLLRVAEPVEGIAGHPLYYIVDRIVGQDEYRVTITIDEKTLTRPYIIENHQAYPVGYWVLKE